MVRYVFALSEMYYKLFVNKYYGEYNGRAVECLSTARQAGR